MNANMNANHLLAHPHASLRTGREDRRKSKRRLAWKIVRRNRLFRIRMKILMAFTIGIASVAMMLD